MGTKKEMFRQFIASARAGNEAAVTVVRECCVEGAKTAPLYELLAIAECMLHLGIEEDKRQAEWN